MHSESHERHLKDPEISLSTDSFSNNHGFTDPEQHCSPQLSVGEGNNWSRRSNSDLAVSETSSEGTSEGSESLLRRLSRSRPSTRSPVDRVSEYENAFSNSSTKKKHGRVAFTVVLQNRKSGLADTAIGDLPNEVLTHVLSHLPPSSLADVSLVSRRLHNLVTTPHAWRIAFSRFFPGAEALNIIGSRTDLPEERDDIRSERRFFTRLTAPASWRSEYVMRTRLLRSLGRGKPADLVPHNVSGSSRSAAVNPSNAQTTYNSNLVSTINHLHASFGVGISKKLPRFIHGTDDLGTASTSDPRNGKADSWGSTDFAAFRQFTDSFPSDAQYGLGDGEIVGIPNVMDVSQTCGMIYGEGLPAGVLYFRHLEEKKGRVLKWTSGVHAPQYGIPSVREGDSVCSVWISKSSSIPDLSDGLIDMLSGSSTGVLSAYSAGTNGMHDRRLERGELTLRWVVSPGVPIVAIVVDDQYSTKRLTRQRIWAVVLNALGEVYYLTEIPNKLHVENLLSSNRISRHVLQQSEVTAWLIGRMVQWRLVEPTRRTAKIDPFKKSDVDSSYSPQSSWDGMSLSQEQLVSETREIEAYLRKKPRDFQSVCHGWDMRRRLEVDFAAWDQSDAGESIFIMDCGLDQGQTAEIRRYTRCSVRDDVSDLSSGASPADRSTDPNSVEESLFGPGQLTIQTQPTWSFKLDSSSSTSSVSRLADQASHEEWRTSVFVFAGLKNPQISSSAIDMSCYAKLTPDEDLLLSPGRSSGNPSLTSSSISQLPNRSFSSDIPGQRARFLAIGTKTGAIILWNMRAPTASNTIVANDVVPIRLIYSDSPEISCLAVTALYLVHGGNDGLVQAWDPLASTANPIRTLNSRFSSRARRRLIQAAASPAGVGINLFAAGALCLDPDPTVLRGMVSLGSHVRYWSYSSLAADKYTGSKRRLRRSERGSNAAGESFCGTGRGALKDYIANEKLELECEKRNKRKEEERLTGRFGVNLLGPGASEDEILAYATMLSEESAQSDALRRQSASDTWSNDTANEASITAPTPLVNVENEDGDSDIAEATRLSLQDSGPQTGSSSGAETSSPGFAVRYARPKGAPSGSSRKAFGSDSHSNASISGTPAGETEDLELALQISLSEQAAMQHGKDLRVGKGKEKEV